MKKISLLVLTFGISLISACSTPSTSNPSANPSSSVNPSTNPSSGSTAAPVAGVGSQFQTRASFIAYLNCIKTKQPSLGPSMDVHISNVNGMTDAQWESSRIFYQSATQAYIASTGC